MTKVKDVIHELEQFAPISFQESWDNSGLLVGNRSEKISSVLLTVDVTEAVIDEAINKKSNLIVAHHPIIFKGLKSLTGRNDIERSIIKAIKHDIAIYVMHTNLDVMEKGVSYKMAEKLALKNIKTLDVTSAPLKKLVVFVPKTHEDTVRSAILEAGAGHIGNYDYCSYNSEGFGTYRAQEGSQPFKGEINQIHKEPEVRIETVFPSHLKSTIVQKMLSAHPYEEVAYDIYTLDQRSNEIGLGKIGELKEAMDEKAFLELLRKEFNLQNLRHTPLLGKKIKKVAVCGGSGSFLIQKAKRVADIYVSADIKYHEFFDAENELIIADIGHFESEQFSKDIFYDIIVKNFSNFAVHFSEINTNPINYL